jgi:7-keto-8-aminopelargonate synthetase-like enzyme
MLGDIAPLKELVAIAKSHGCMVLVDEAHGMGFFGANGRGVYEAAGVAADVDFVVGTFSKSVGTVGGFCVSNHPKFEILRLVCRPYTFTASLPPAVVACAATSIRKLMHAEAKRERLWEMTRTLHGGLKARGFRLATETPESAIVSVLMPDQETTIRMWAAMIGLGVYVNMSRPPATPAGVFLLRCSLCDEHTAEQLAIVLNRFTEAAVLTELFGATKAA